MPRYKPAIFCIEGEWSPRLDDTKSVRPLLETLKNVGQIDFIHRTAGDPEAFGSLVRRWGQKQYAKYSVGYFALHGSEGMIWFGRKALSLEDLAKLLEGRLRGRMVYFGSCSTLNVEQQRIDEFRKITGARAVIGYSEDVNWMESAAFDLLLLEAMTYFRRANEVGRWLRERHGPFAKQLGLVIHYGRGQTA